MCTCRHGTTSLGRKVDAHGGLRQRTRGGRSVSGGAALSGQLRSREGEQRFGRDVPRCVSSTVLGYSLATWFSITLFECMSVGTLLYMSLYKYMCRVLLYSMYIPIGRKGWYTVYPLLVHLHVLRSKDRDSLPCEMHCGWNQKLSLSTSGCSAHATCPPTSVAIGMSGRKGRLTWFVTLLG